MDWPHNCDSRGTVGHAPCFGSADSFGFAQAPQGKGNGGDNQGRADEYHGSEDDYEDRDVASEAVREGKATPLQDSRQN